MSLSIEEWKALSASGRLELEVVSDSMYPTLRVGDVIKVRPLGDALPGKGMVTVFYKEGIPPLVVHRCLGNMRFRGDNRLNDDPPVSKRQLVGYVEELIRNGRCVKVDGSGLIKLHRAGRRCLIRLTVLAGKLKRLVKRR